MRTPRLRGGGNPRRRWLLAAVPAVVIALAACGGGGDDESDSASSGAGGYSPADATNAAADGTRVDLQPVNGSAVTARSLVVKGDQTITVSLAAEGLEPGRQHRLNIHRYEDERAVRCATTSDDRNGDGRVDLDEGETAWGPIALELLPSPTADEDGTAAFEGTFPLAASKIYNGVIVVSGATVDGAFDPSIPVACGQLGV